MNKELYFQLCESMGSEPIEEEIPIELTDLSVVAQQALFIHSILPDRLGEMSGIFLGKDFSSLPSFLDAFDVSKNDWLLYLELIGIIDSTNTELINKKLKQKTKQSVKIVKDQGITSGNK